MQNFLCCYGDQVDLSIRQPIPYLVEWSMCVYDRAWGGINIEHGTTLLIRRARVVVKIKVMIS